MRKKINLLTTRIDNIIYKKIIKNIMFTSRLGRRTIFGYADSGINFDKIYLNKPKGYSKLGTFVEFVLLNLPAAKATRNRQIQLKKIISNEIRHNQDTDNKTRILNLASGPARYLTELINKENEKQVEILCFDNDKNSLRLGKAITSKLSFTRFIKANVLKLDRYKNIGRIRNWYANIILASGFYFYCEDDTVQRSFKEVYDHLENKGLFIFDNLVGNPNKELLARIGITKTGKPWEFYYRKPNQIISWLKTIGFIEIETINDKWNMYIIYKARKP
jgi:SAM-dependent methyltransferase